VTEVVATGAAGVRWRWTLLLPPGWVRLPTGAAEGRRAVTALLDRRLQHVPRDAVAQSRRAMQAELHRVLEEARQAGASEVYSQMDLVHGLPVSAGLTVSRVQVPADREQVRTGLGGVLGTGEGVVESGGAEVNGLPALRRRRHLLREPAPGAAPQPHVAVDWVVPLPDGDDVLLLAFATSTTKVAEELVQLFDAIAQSIELEPLPG
jgi:hypothetical protein